jgi:biopolymer transport protein ExbB
MWPPMQRRGRRMRGRAGLQKWVPAASALIFLLLLPSVAHAWWNDDWSYRKKITIDASPKGAPLGEDPGRMPLLVRLHDGNFKFGDAKDDGSDLRFVAADDKTPLKYHIEKFDAVFGLAFIWVDVPGVRNGVGNDIWMYYGNAKAPAGGDARGTYDDDQVLVYHFSDKEGPPRDQTAYKNDAQTPGRADDASLIGGGLKFDGSTIVTVPGSPSLAVADGGAMTWSGWIKADAEQETGIIFARHDGDKSLVIGLAQGAPYVAVGDGVAVARSDPGQALAAATWHHIAVAAAADHIALFVDGKASASVAAHLPALASAATLGGDAAPDRAAFVGSLDELEISKIARSAGYIAAAAASQGPEGRLVAYGEDEQTASWTGGYFVVILKSVTIDGWVVIAILMVMAVVSWTLMVAKAGQIRRAGRGNARFVRAFRGAGHDPAAFEDLCRGSLCG